MDTVTETDTHQDKPLTGAEAIAQAYRTVFQSATMHAVSQFERDALNMAAEHFQHIVEPALLKSDEDGTSGQDRDCYTDTQDRDSYSVSPEMSPEKSEVARMMESRIATETMVDFTDKPGCTGRTARG